MVKPILFNTDMVNAIREGCKTVTRRVIKPTQMQGIAPDRCPNHTPEEFVKEKPLLFEPYCDMSDEDMIKAIFKSPYQKDDILYVRETWAYISDWIAVDPDVGVFDGYFYKADWDNNAKKAERPKWKPSIFMPKEAARIFLRVTNVSVARIQDITTKDMQKEGLTSMAVFAGDKEIARQEWALLWDGTITGKDYNKFCFSSDPWVWVIEFERTGKPNEWV